ncbi:MAG: hypothetical protein ACKVQW_01865 [Pyrinomonadaceae bacterium]
MTKGFLRLTVAVVLASSPFIINAQPKSRPKPLATPVPTLTGAEIISRAEDYQEPPRTESQVEKPVEKPATTTSARIKELTERIKKLEETREATYDEKQKRMLLNLDILTRAEQRSESLRKQLFEMIEKENSIKMRLDQIDLDARPEAIERSLQMAGSLRPEDVRESRRKTLLAEKNNLAALLLQIQQNRTNLEMSVSKADLMVEKLRAKLEKDIDESFLKDDPDN